MAVKIDMDKCMKCLACISACPQGAISEEDGEPKVDASKCTNCGNCIEACPAEAISK